MGGLPIWLVDTMLNSDTLGISPSLQVAGALVLVHPN